MRISDWSSDVCSSDLDADQQPRSERNLGTPRSLDRFKPPRRNFIGRAKMRSPAFGETVGSGLQHQANRRGHRPKRRIVTFIHQPRIEVWQKNWFLEKNSRKFTQQGKRRGEPEIVQPTPAGKRGR